ncbi:AAA family ATPase [bacterium]|nr:AAA family ATPase [bacterium]
MFKRSLQLPAPGRETFFLWGPRQAGKTTRLREVYPEAMWIDLLRAEDYRRYLQNPERRREELRQRPVAQVVIDEVQKVRQLLDEVHGLLAQHGVQFARADRARARCAAAPPTSSAGGRCGTNCSA